MTTLVNNCGAVNGDMAAKEIVLQPPDSFIDSHAFREASGICEIDSALFKPAKSSECSSVLCRFLQIIQLENLHF